MRLITVTWQELAPGALVVDPSGRVWSVRGCHSPTATAPACVDLRDVEGDETQRLEVELTGLVETLTTTQQAAAMVLSRYFPDMERI